MTEDKRYNGWKNYETWNVALWIGNEEGSYNYWRERSQECWDNASADKNFTREENASIGARLPRITWKTRRRLRSPPKSNSPQPAPEGSRVRP